MNELQTAMVITAAQNAGNGDVFIYGLGSSGYVAAIVFIFFLLGIIVFIITLYIFISKYDNII